MSISTQSNLQEKRVEYVGDYIIQEQIGQGSFATVFKAQHKETEKTVAIKCVKRSKLTKKLLENLESEISILTEIRHEHIVGLIECQKTESNIFLLMEFCSLGDLSHYIKEIRSNKATKGAAGGLPERNVRHFLKQLANALQFLRSKNLIHRDIKPQNLLLTPAKDKNELPTLKIADFGFARFLPNASLADTLCGSPLYMGPEILSYKKYDAKADLWSVGAVLYEMITGRPPFRAQNHIELLKKIQETNDQIHFPDEKHTDIVIGLDIKDLIRKLLKKNPMDRLSFEDFFKHPSILIHDSNQFISKPHIGSYEPPPFAQIHSKTISDQLPRRWSAGNELRSNERQETNLIWRPSESKKKNNNSSPEIQKKNNSSPEIQKNNSLNINGNKKEDEDMLHEYVVLDIRSIETNQFADELKATPRYEDHHNMSHAMNIPNSQPIDKKPSSTSSSPFMRERKSSTSSSAGSALAKALNKASVRLFGTSMPSPPKEDPLLFIPGNHRAMKKIKWFICMANAVKQFGDQKYELFGREGGGRILQEEIMALYMKALGLLETGLSIAQNYWQQELMDDEEEKKLMSEPLNNTVQWMRDNFNECLERAESMKIEQSDLGCVEKLLYIKALEMGRQAAVHQVVGENISECEQDYQTAIYLLQAILEVHSSTEIVIEEDDRKIINTVIDSIRRRITELRKRVASERV